MRGGKVGRPSTAMTWAERVRELLRGDSGLSTAELLRRLRLQGYPGGKTAFYQMVAVCRSSPRE